LMDMSKAACASDIVFKYPCSRRVLEQATGVIVHSEFSRRLAAQFFGSKFAKKMVHIPLLRGSQTEVNRVAARQMLGFQEDDFVVCSFGFLSKSKLNDRLLAAWLASPLAQDKRCRLVFVGENETNANGARLEKTIQECTSKERISITGFADMELFRSYLAAADLAVQLRTLSRGETSAAILDCFGFGLPVIVNEHGTAGEIPKDIVEMLPDGFTDQELAAALVKLRDNPTLRETLAGNAKAHLRSHHDPAEMGKKYFEAIELFDQATPHLAQRKLANALAQIDMPMDYGEPSFVALAQSIAQNQGQVPGSHRQLLVDVTSLLGADIKTGIQRVVENVLWELLKIPQSGFRVEPVYITQEGLLCYARKFMGQWITSDATHWVDEPIDARMDDLLLGLDLPWVLESGHSSLFDGLRNRGVEVLFFVHDLPKPFSEKMIRHADGFLCVTRVVADELLARLDGANLSSQRPLKVGCLHLDANTDASFPKQGGNGGFIQGLASLSSAENIWKDAAKQIKTILVDNEWYPKKQGICG